ncbi:GNAT family N-acetyltransferase [Novosphingobium sp.]|jgi:RimJ/RimL family protein N-acetyltransferase|uniref:GNAT family N-acetyltransferase n=1 Tax=Novosphingobium sp. TaxID=1874826 RepID=UPI0022C07779|nr:GNAT family N-acetyltransferase [Novosphingobium sp.]MCZ8018920.1 GNAT family N-acetyltransferase [Novosphingobium sp.]MCZ8034526.1 GNAT family N-acetyltransferase [Novosphingobium sp.]MCZ8052074.1 GNAT family N-acetyltransferase [Novosphingobium sp.]MCZ8060000.1 GNAT family N-acetyltransferase [Novosphingobium sp.]MCZ8230962.1 GNAT family N-acetyltransferase [Novosphingobium sp.]
MAEFRLETERLVLRSWRDADLDPFHAVCSDPEVMATLGPVMSRDEVAALIERMRGIEAEHGHCFWAMVRRADDRLIGWCGVIRGSVGPIVDKAELGWRMARDCWGAGYATEAASAARDWVFANRGDDAVYAITNVDNWNSRKVMERIGMTRLADGDFDHPKVPPGDPLVPHVTYRMTRAAWSAR